MFLCTYLPTLPDLLPLSFSLLLDRQPTHRTLGRYTLSRLLQTRIVSQFLPSPTTIIEHEIILESSEDCEVKSDKVGFRLLPF